MKRPSQVLGMQENDPPAGGWRVLPIYIGTGYVAIKKQIINT